LMNSLKKASYHSGGGACPDTLGKIVALRKAHTKDIMGCLKEFLLAEADVALIKAEAY